jgi:hypothetical protein
MFEWFEHSHWAFLRVGHPLQGTVNWRFILAQMFVAHTWWAPRQGKSWCTLCLVTRMQVDDKSVYGQRTVYYIAWMKGIRKVRYSKFDAEYRKVSGHLGDLDVNRRLILRWILRKQDVKMLTGFICLSVWFTGGHRYESPGSIRQAISLPFSSCYEIKFHRVQDNTASLIILFYGYIFRPFWDIFRP